MTSSARTAAAALLVTLGSLLCGCGYSTRLNVATELADVSTVGVEIFGNDTLERDLERELHAELTRTVRSLIDADLVAPGQADVVLRGKLTQFARRGGIRSLDNELLQTGVLIAVEAALVERATEEELTGPMDIAVDVGFTLTGVGMESDARQRAVRNLADRIALDLFTAAAIRKPADPGQDKDPETELNH